MAFNLVKSSATRFSWSLFIKLGYLRLDILCKQSGKYSKEAKNPNISERFKRTWRFEVHSIGGIYEAFNGCEKGVKVVVLRTDPSALLDRKVVTAHFANVSVNLGIVERRVHGKEISHKSSKSVSIHNVQKVVQIYIRKQHFH
jgi:hypothetical protein